MSEIHVFDEPEEEPDDAMVGGAENTVSASVLQFPAKKEEEVKPGEWEAELPDADNPETADLEEGAPVDAPRAVYPPSVAEWMAAHDKARQPVLPDWVKLPDQRKAVRKWAMRHYSTMVGYHAVRLPCVYVPKLLVYSPRGAWRWSAAVGRWVSDAEGKALRLAAVASEDAREYLKLSRQRDARVKLRSIIATLSGFVGLAAALTVYVMAASWLLTLAIATMTTALGVAGTPADRPLIDRARVAFRKRKLSSDVITRAFTAAGLTTKDQGIAFPRPIGRDGDGWRVVVDLPYGKGFNDALAKRRALASGIDIAPTQIFLDPDLSSERRVSLWIADRDPLAVPAGRTPLLGATRVDFWKPFPWGVDERGNPVMATLLWLSLLVGAVPRR
ncbi:hypothetical protein [Streptomyces sp. H27-C3]|uniref:hypothetical protein n=1 Tax=Streptomyces sp. H27-C3 TaxID=3046305 RepID=UPI0024B9E4F7|nr:hypothetical protein [Streptomyces sp. H27-C3]MDJ0461502.1 hypothetical protein [Streptomyces sp. H27-C3]